MRRSPISPTRPEVTSIGGVRVDENVDWSNIVAECARIGQAIAGLNTLPLTIAVWHLAASMSATVCSASSLERRYESTRFMPLLHASQLTIEWLRDGLGQRDELGLCHVTGEEDHLTGRAEGHDGYVVDPTRRAHVRKGLSRKRQFKASFGGGHEQRHALAAILQHDVGESPSPVDARVPFEHVSRPKRSHDVIWRDRLEHTICGTVALRGVFERDRLLGELEL